MSPFIPLIIALRRIIVYNEFDRGVKIRIIAILRTNKSTTELYY